MRNNQIMGLKHVLDHVISWEPEGRYKYSKMFRWEPEGHYLCTKSMAIAPFWFSREHRWIVIVPFWLSTDDILNGMLTSIEQAIGSVHESVDQQNLNGD